MSEKKRGFLGRLFGSKDKPEEQVEPDDGSSSAKLPLKLLQPAKDDPGPSTPKWKSVRLPR